MCATRGAIDQVERGNLIGQHHVAQTDILGTQAIVACANNCHCHTHSADTLDHDAQHRQHFLPGRSGMHRFKVPTEDHIVHF